jgi:ADP-heptose:LPS heptosyltransferase
LGGKPLIGIHVGSGATKNLALRRWPAEHYLQLIKIILAQHPEAAVLLLGGPEEKADHDRILGAVQSNRVMAPRTRNIREAAAMLTKCAMFISVDTALMHLAAAVKVPKQIVIETPTCNKTVEPYGNRFVLVPNPEVHGRTLDFYRYDGRGIRGGESSIKQTMQSIRAGDVFKVLEEAWKNTPQT